MRFTNGPKTLEIQRGGGRSPEEMEKLLSLTVATLRKEAHRIATETGEGLLLAPALAQLCYEVVLSCADGDRREAHTAFVAMIAATLYDVAEMDMRIVTDDEVT